MKKKILVAYSTNKDKIYQKRFNSNINKTIGLSLKKGEYIIFPFENDGEYSLTKVYNLILEKHKDLIESDEYIFVFCHHDIKILTNGWGKNLINIFNNNDVDILGVAGSEVLLAHGIWWLNEKLKADTTYTWGKVWHPQNKTKVVSNYSTDYKKCKKVQPCVVIDGIFISFNPNSIIDFDEEFDGFHMYDISFCIENIIFGKKIAVTETIQILHESIGQLSIKWDENRKKMIEIYKDYLPMRIEDDAKTEETKIEDHTDTN